MPAKDQLQCYRETSSPETITDKFKTTKLKALYHCLKENQKTASYWKKNPISDPTYKKQMEAGFIMTEKAIKSRIKRERTIIKNNARKKK